MHAAEETPEQRRDPVPETTTKGTEREAAVDGPEAGSAEHRELVHEAAEQADQHQESADR